MYGRSIAEFGAVGNGRSDDAPAIQAALNAGQPLITIPYGRYKIGHTLRISSHTRLSVHPRAHLFLAAGAGQNADSFLLTNKHHASGDQNIVIEGGIWDGNNPANRRGPDAPDSYTGVLLNFTHVRGLTLQQLTLRDPESYFIRLGKVTRFRIADITFQIRHLRPNQDGVHVTGHCADGVIRQLRGSGPQTPNDDMVAILADDALHRAQNLGAFNGPIRRIRVADLQADSCHSFIRLLSFKHPIEEIDISDVRGGCRCCAINMDACRQCAVKLFDSRDYPQGVGHIAGVRVRRMHVFSASDHTQQPLLDFRTRVADFVIEDFQRDHQLDISPGTPTLRVAEVGRLPVVLEGLTPQQKGTLTADDDRLVEMATPHNHTRYWGTFQLDERSELFLPSGGFSRLAAGAENL